MNEQEKDRNIERKRKTGELTKASTHQGLSGMEVENGNLCPCVSVAVLLTKSPHKMWKCSSTNLDGKYLKEWLLKSLDLGYLKVRLKV